MDDEGILGDVDAWFEAFERGDFLSAWKLQQAALQAQFVASCKQYDTSICTVICDASLD